jgi:hypothetical protein
MTDTTRKRDAGSHERLIHELEAQHSAFDRTLAEELRRPAPDPVLIRRLKRAKLALKDRAMLLAQRTASATPSPARG